MKRAVDKVTLTEHQYTFLGRRFGLSTGCWIVPKIVARRICELYNTDLPKLGYANTLKESLEVYKGSSGRTFPMKSHSTVSNHAGKYIVRLAPSLYTYQFTEKFA